MTGKQLLLYVQLHQLALNRVGVVNLGNYLSSGYRSSPTYRSQCVLVREKEVEREQVRDSNFSIDITDFTHPAPNCLSSLKETPWSNEAAVLCQQRLVSNQWPTFLIVWKAFAAPLWGTKLFFLTSNESKYCTSPCSHHIFLIFLKPVFKTTSQKIPSQRPKIKCWRINKTMKGRKPSPLLRAPAFIINDPLSRTITAESDRLGTAHWSFQVAKPEIYISEYKTSPKTFKHCLHHKYSE